MKYIKTYEKPKIRVILENENFREVDLGVLWDDYTKYRNQILEEKLITFNNVSKSGIKGIAEEFMEKVFEPLIDRKYIEWNRRKDPITDEISYSQIGKVKNVFLNITDIIPIFSATFYHAYGPKLPPNRRNTIDNNEYILLKPYHKNFYVKIYNSELTEIEEAINFFKDANNYNL
jgi:hypothetical protein